MFGMRLVPATTLRELTRILLLNSAISASRPAGAVTGVASDKVPSWKPPPNHIGRPGWDTERVDWFVSNTSYWRDPSRTPYGLVESETASKLNPIPRLSKSSTSGGWSISTEWVWNILISATSRYRPASITLDTPPWNTTRRKSSIAPFGNWTYLSDNPGASTLIATRSASIHSGVQGITVEFPLIVWYALAFVKLNPNSRLYPRWSNTADRWSSFNWVNVRSASGVAIAWPPDAGDFWILRTVPSEKTR